jgi:superfamily I DNA/RNA helicase
MKLSPQQATFAQVLKEGQSSILLSAVAGSGKTSALVEAVRGLDPALRILCVAFNKRIATELESRMPPHVTCKTLNGVGHGAWMRRCSPKRVNLDTSKTRNLLNVLAPEGAPAIVPRLVALAKSVGLVPQGAPGAPAALLADTDESWYDLVEHHNLDEDPETNLVEAITLARRVLHASIEQALAGVIDFDDQLYMSTCYLAPFAKFDVVLVDEAQDVSPIQRAMLRLLLAPGGRLAAVGDPRQAIYGFRGADAESFRRIQEEFSAVELPLTVSFRCPKSVVREAQRWVSHIESAPDAPEGSVTSLARYTPRTFGPADAILCRNNKPLVALAYRLIRRGVGCTVLGRDIGTGLASLIKKLNAKGIDRLIEKLEDWKARELAKCAVKQREAQAAAIEDKADTIAVLIDQLPETNRTIPALLALIDQLFSDATGTGRLVLSSIHKSKGLEWERVFWLDPGLLPSKWARSDWQKTQEANLQYVCATRAKRDLVYITTEGLADEDPEN